MNIKRVILKLALRDVSFWKVSGKNYSYSSKSLFKAIMKYFKNRNKKDTNLSEYDVFEKMLINDIKYNKLTKEEAEKGCMKLYKLIPYDTDLNPVYLIQLMKEKYGN